MGTVSKCPQCHGTGLIATLRSADTTLSSCFCPACDASRRALEPTKHGLDDLLFFAVTHLSIEEAREVILKHKQVQPAHPASRATPVTAETVAREPSKIGARQTRYVVLHPKRGFGFVGVDNGPALFEQPNVSIQCEIRVFFNKGEALRMEDPEHGTVDLCVLSKGPVYRRVWSRFFDGMGWLQWPTGESATFRLEMDNGQTLQFDYNRLGMGPPAYCALVANPRKTRSPTEEEKLWITIDTRDGSRLVFRRDGPPPAEHTAVDLGREVQPALPHVDLRARKRAARSRRTP